MSKRAIDAIWADGTAHAVFDRLYDDLKHDDVLTEEWRIIYTKIRDIAARQLKVLDEAGL